MDGGWEMREGESLGAERRYLADRPRVHANIWTYWAESVSEGANGRTGGGGG